MRALLLLYFVFSLSVAAAQTSGLEIGVVQDIENDTLLKNQGYRFLVESTNKMLSPRTVSDAQFNEKLKTIKRSAVLLYGCNIFLPGDLKVVGPSINENAILDYVDTVFSRAKRAGVSMIVWGSSGSRRLPDGYDRALAKRQFIAIARRIAVVASKYQIVVALENLNSEEVNFITTLNEALEIVKAVDHKNLRLCADFYHMLKMNEGPAVIAKARGYLVYCELAEKDGRTPPGVHSENFRPYFAALKSIQFTGKIAIECRWDNVGNQGKAAITEVQRQLLESF